MINYIQIDKNSIPYRQDVRIAAETFGFVFNYNEEGDFFTCDLYKGEELLAAGEKVVYGKALFSAVADNRFPAAAIIPGDISDQESVVTWDTLGQNVFLYVISGEEIENVQA